MARKKTIIRHIFKWNLKEFILAILGTFLVCFGINKFIVPNGLYNGGILGIAQLLRNLINNFFNLETNIDIAGIINLIINIPLFILAYRHISKTFFRRTIICVILESFFFTIIPIPETMIVDELITSVLIGGIIVGFGAGLVLASNASLGGTDIISISATMRRKGLSVGKVGMLINIIIFGIAGILYGTKTMIYSIIYCVIDYLVVDRLHVQNISSTATIFTKENPENIIEFVKNELDRDVTTWVAKGEGSNSKTHICYIVLSKYELERLERYLPLLSKKAFLVKNDNVSVYGNFKKVLTK